MTEPKPTYQVMDEEVIQGIIKNIEGVLLHKSGRSTFCKFKFGGGVFTFPLNLEDDIDWLDIKHYIAQKQYKLLAEMI